MEGVKLLGWLHLDASGISGPSWLHHLKGLGCEHPLHGPQQGSRMGAMGQSRTTFGAVLFWGFLGPLALVVGAQGSVFSDPTLLACGRESLQLTLPPGREGNASFVLTAWGKPELCQEGLLLLCLCVVQGYAWNEEEGAGFDVKCCLTTSVLIV